jgi:MoxR-like ATPase
MTLDEAQRLASRLRDELGRAIIGQHAVVQEILTAFFAGGHCLLRGVPGLAKTLLIKTLAQAIDLKFNRIQFTPDLMPSDIIGTEAIEEDRAAEIVRFIRDNVQAPRGPQRRHPMRSAWWLVPFAACLSGEWWLRRRHGQR